MNENHQIKLDFFKKCGCHIILTYSAIDVCNFRSPGCLW